MPNLFDPVVAGDLTLPNRVFLAPLTRMRSRQPGNIPWELNAEYYAQRSSAGLLISEATQVSQQGQGYPGTPGIHSPEQVEGWKLATKAVHAKGGKFFLQLWHVGRISHSSHQPGGGPPVSPSALKPSGMTFTAGWEQVPFETPRALELSEIPGIVADFRRGAENAKAAGFDGVEIHGANGYLIDQFLQDGTNKRTDAYGGSIENRMRFLLEIVDAAASVWGAGRVGVRLSPFGTFNDMSDSDPAKLFSAVLNKLGEKQIAYAHIVQPRATNAGSGGADKSDEGMPDTARLFRDAFPGTLVSAGGFDRESALRTVAEGVADAVAFGRLFIANPDLPARLKANIPLNPYNRATFYGGGAEGYTDYPFAE